MNIRRKFINKNSNWKYTFFKISNYLIFLKQKPIFNNYIIFIYPVKIIPYESLTQQGS
jgi:hypothetical protein